MSVSTSPRNDAPRRPGRGFQSVHRNARNLPHSPASSTPRIDFATLNRDALPYLPELLGRWLPDGRKRGREWVSINPKRADRHSGSFSINIATGRWADFASGDRGGDVVSLACYLFDLRPGEAARLLAECLGREVPRG